MVQAGFAFLYFAYISAIVYIIFKYHEKTKHLKKMNESFLMAIHDIKNYSVNIDASTQLGHWTICLQAFSERNGRGTVGRESGRKR